MNWFWIYLPFHLIIGFIHYGWLNYSHYQERGPATIKEINDYNREARGFAILALVLGPLGLLHTLLISQVVGIVHLKRGFRL